MSGCNLIVDLPTVLLREIFKRWLGGFKKIGRKSTLNLDSALCNKQARSTLLDLYQQFDFSNFFTEQRCCVAKRMKWAIGRIRLSSLELYRFPNDAVMMKAFFRWNARHLKVLKLINSTGAMSALTKAIVECKVLEVLWLYGCKLTMPLATVLNKTATIKELRLRNRRCADFSQSLLERICCPSITKLALLDRIPEGCDAAVRTAFPNANEVTLCEPTSSIVNAFLNDAQCHTLRLEDSCYSGDSMQAQAEIVSEQRREHLLSLTFDGSRSYKSTCLSAIVLKSLLAACPYLISVSLWIGDWRGFKYDVVTTIAEQCTSRLQVLRISNNQLTSASISKLAANCTQLRVLNIGHSTFQSSKISMSPVIMQCSQLERLRVRNFTIAESRSMIETISNHCPATLEVLNIGSLTDYSETGNVEKITLQGLNRCPALRLVQLCDAVSIFIDIKIKAAFKVAVVPRGTMSVEAECNF